eukprot:6210119-Pleurochrysis_carterae.AAC.1
MPPGLHAPSHAATCARVGARTREVAGTSGAARAARTQAPRPSSAPAAAAARENAHAPAQVIAHAPACTPVRAPVGAPACGRLACTISPARAAHARTPARPSLAAVDAV